MSQLSLCSAYCSQIVIFNEYTGGVTWEEGPNRFLEVRITSWPRVMPSCLGHVGGTVASACIHIYPLSMPPPAAKAAMLSLLLAGPN